jgi:antimicrobial peptide system SdpB family protein
MKIIINSYNLGRTILAIGTLLTLLVNSNYTLFGNQFISYNTTSIYDYTLFNLLENNLMIAKIISIVVLIIVISGYYPKLTGILHFYVTFSFFVACDIIDGGDHIASNLTLLLLPITLLDNSKNHWFKSLQIKNKVSLVVYCSFYLLICIQVSVIYFHAFVGKLYIEEWIDGTDTYYWFTHTYFGINDIFVDSVKYILSYPIIVVLITWGTLFFEFLLSSAIFMKKNNKIRYSLLVFGILFHFSILIIHGLVSFFFTMTAALILYLLPFNTNYKLQQIKFNLFKYKLWQKT